MQGRLNLPTVMFYGVALLMIIICIGCFASAFSWINKPFAGFLVYKDSFISASGERDWPGPTAGLKFRERILTVDGVATKDGPEIVQHIRSKEIGANVRYQVESAGQIREVQVPVTRFTLGDFLTVFLTPFIVGVIIYLLGFVVYVLKPSNATSWAFLILCFSLGTMILAGFENQSSYYVVRLHYAINTLYAANFLHLFLIFPDRKQIVKRFPWIEYIVYIPAIILIGAYEIYWAIFRDIFSGAAFTWFPTYRELGSINRVFTLFCVAGMIALIFHAMFRASDLQARQRARVIFWGVFISFGPPVVIMTMVFFWKINFPWNFLVFFVVFFPAAIAYSIVKHNLFDADVLIKRTVGYVLVTAIVIGAYALVTVLFNVFMGQYQLAQSKAFPILFTVGVILVFNPLRDRVQALVDKIFFRKEYDANAILEKVGGAITSMLDLSAILKRLTQTFIGDMFIDVSSVMLLTPDGTSYRVSLADGDDHEAVEALAIDRKDPLIDIIEKEKRELTRFDILESPQYRDVSETCMARFDALRASLMIPLVFQGNVIGLMNLGQKKSGKVYNRDDIDLLHTLANQCAVSIENARLFQENLEKQRMEEELNIARDLQTSMLPAECPQIDGFKIAAFSLPAMEVGGDFYDFAETEAGNLAMLIGDVTGKSVSGALVMSASRSIFRMLSEETLSVADIMNRANRRAKKDIKSGMFVALLYATLNPETRVLTICSAGQTQPIYLSAKTGEAKLLETRGDTFPLGILADAEYEETHVQLEAGDQVVLYTDGVVEAMDPKGEIFGFDRLLEAVKQAEANSAEALLNHLKGQVDVFVGEAPQHDDLTVIVISVEH